MLDGDKHSNLLYQFVSYEKMKCSEYASRAVGLGGELSLIKGKAWKVFSLPAMAKTPEVLKNFRNFRSFIVYAVALGLSC
jgi:hypothetical protein